MRDYLDKIDTSTNPHTPVFKEYPKSDMDILKEEKIRATFFVTAGWMREHPDLVGRMKAEGHDIGTMGVSHENLSEQTSAEIRAELQEAEHTAKE